MVGRWLERRNDPRLIVLPDGRKLNTCTFRTSAEFTRYLIDAIESRNPDRLTDEEWSFLLNNGAVRAEKALDVMKSAARTLDPDRG
jgi:hypothetical protein